MAHLDLAIYSQPLFQKTFGISCAELTSGHLTDLKTLISIFGSVIPLS